jgi:hypothetical protein
LSCCLSRQPLIGALPRQADGEQKEESPLSTRRRGDRAGEKRTLVRTLNFSGRKATIESDERLSTTSQGPVP